MIRRLKRLHNFLRHLLGVTSYYRYGNVFLGKDVLIEPGVVLYTDEKSLIVVENNVLIESNCKFYATNGSRIYIKSKARILSGTEISTREAGLGGLIEIGHGASIHRDSRIDITGNVYIEDDVKTGERCFIHTHIHNYDKPGSIWDQGIRVGNVKVKKGCWIGTNVQIMPDVVIGEGSIIGAGAVVTENIDPYVIAGGIPAKKIKDRFEVHK